MKLISKHRDYYDLALAQGQDDQVVYVRKTSSLTLPSKDVWPWDAQDPTNPRHRVGQRHATLRKKPGPRYQRDWEYVETIVLIAGHAYPCWVRQPLPASHPHPTIDGQPIPYGSPSLDSLIKKIAALELAVPGADPHFDILVETRIAGTWFRKHDDRFDSVYQSALEAVLAKDWTSFHLDVEAPVVHVSPGNRPGTINVVLNPNLQDMDMMVTLDPYTCFQNISQFISGVVPGQQMPMATISDKSQVLKKGFDPKYGFRKRPQQ